MKNPIDAYQYSIDYRFSLHKPVLSVLMLVFFLSSSMVNAKGIYKWTDENGETHYSAQRPEDSDAEKMKLYVPEPASQPESKKTTPEEEQVEPTEDDKAKQERVEYCKKERELLQTVLKNKELYEKDATGKETKIKSKARIQRLEKIKANISKYCK